MKVPYLNRRISALDFTYYLFMASVPLELLGTIYFRWPISLSKPAGALFIVSYFISRKERAFIFVPPPLIMAPILWVTVAFGHYLLSDSTDYVGVLTGITNNIILSVILYNYLLREPAGIKNGLLLMGLSTGISSIFVFSIFGLDMLRGERFTILDFDQNNIASIYGLGSLILLLLFPSGKGSFKMSLILLPLMLTSILIVVATGSRGGMIALGLSFIFYILFVSRAKLLRPKTFLISAAVMAVAIMAYLESPTTQQRWQYTIDGDGEVALAERDQIAGVVFELIAEKPMFGWGLDRGISATGAALGKDAAGSHNTYLMIILTSGVIGGAPLLYYIFFPFFRWRKNANSDQFRMLSVLLFFSMVIFLSLDMLNRKQYWVISTMLLATMARPAAPERK